MDPNATLEAIMAVVVDWEENDADVEFEDFSIDDLRQICENYDTICENTRALHDWIIKGGFLPNEWKK